MLLLRQSFMVLATVFPFALTQGDSGVTTATLERTFTAFATSQPSSVATTRVTKFLDTTTLTTTLRNTTTSPLQYTVVIPYVYLTTVDVTCTYKATTDTITITSTRTQYDITNSTSTSYTNVTANATTTLFTESVITVSTPTGFVPVEESSGDENYSGTIKRRDTDPGGDVLFPRQAIAPPDTSYISLISIVTRLVPRTTSTIFVTVTKTSIVRPPRTVTQPTTSTVTRIVGVPDAPVNSTVVVTASTTENVTNTITFRTETTVATITNTQLNYTATRSTYLACASNNLLGPRIQDRSYISNVVDNTRSNVGTRTDATSSYECCTICQDVDGFCDFAYYDTEADTAGNNCVLFKANAPKKGGSSATCAHAKAGFYNTNNRTENRWVVMNGPCGQLVHGNPNK
ncbi:uncharacterized protein A1O5_03632 [Cladophialophora psammophila CBS 110553]|uniref:Apple domain-containing protein n=1 Tax=Cladophialophora psammophila CBS 110553 TaxID=1182543 RepID=W9X991_9EURO|nr:uncharacterized protein A1O5_03632 [Cladophialophora psammophila CBS 110553]EXJ73870.1 hypothetical protein A1O5_03632 [Cladophialophora psammophila CBS 110553]